MSGVHVVEIHVVYNVLLKVVFQEMNCLHTFKHDDVCQVTKSTKFLSVLRLVGGTGPKGSPGSPGPRSGGVTFVRWGRTTRPEGTEPVYTGRVAHSGGGSNYQCITLEPENFDFGTGTTAQISYIYGTE